MKRSGSMRLRVAGAVASLVVVVASTQAIGSPVAPRALARRDGDSSGKPSGTLAVSPGTSAFLPLAAARQDILRRPPDPTTPPTPTDAPTAAPTPTATAFTCPALTERIRVREIDTYPWEVKVKRGRNEQTSSIFLAPDPSGAGSHVAWSDTEGGVHLTALDELDMPARADTRLVGDEVRGLAVHSDGVALLVVRGESLYLLRLDADGSVRFETHVIGGGSHDVAGDKWVDSWGHEARLIYADHRYGVYSGHTQQFGAKGKHQGDLLWFYDESGQKFDVRDDWDWGCSHSLDVRLAHNGTRFGPVCLSDAYPSEGFHFNHRTTEIRSERSGDGRGYSAANLGGWVPLADGFLMSFSSPEGRKSSDVGLIRVGNDGTTRPEAWLTDTAAVEESEPHLARFGDVFLASWLSDEGLRLAVVDQSGRSLDGPWTAGAQIAARDDIVALPGGDVGWGYAWGDFLTLKIVRVAWCSDRATTTPPAPATPTE